MNTTPKHPLAKFGLGVVVIAGFALPLMILFHIPN